MFIQKVFHVHLDLDRTKARLADLRSYRRALGAEAAATSTDEGTLRFAFKTVTGFQAEIEVAPLPSDEPYQTLFRSVGGNVEVAGLIEYFAVRDQLTEVVLTLDYTINSPVHHVIDSVTLAMDRFLNRQLRRIEAHLAESSPSRSLSNASQANFAGNALPAH